MSNYSDRFVEPSCAWLRGVCVGTEKPGPLEIKRGQMDNHFTLSGCVFHPSCFCEFDLSLSWAFTELAEDAAIVLAFGKAHEWSSVAEAVLQIRVDRSGGVEISNKEHVIGTLDVPSATSEVKTLQVRRYGDSIRVGDQSFPLPAAACDTSGFFTIMAENAPLSIPAISIESNLDHVPMTDGQREDDIASWKAWRMARNTEALSTLEDAAEDAGARNEWGFSTDLVVSPGLLAVGETVSITFKSSGSIPENSEAFVEADYLSEGDSRVEPIALHWREQGDDTVVACSEFNVDRPGNWRVTWMVGTKRLSRVFGVIDDGYAVCTLWVGSNTPIIDEEIHRFDLPGDYWIGDWWSPFDKRPQDVLDYLRPYIDLRHRFGDRLVPFANAGWILPGVPNFNLFEIDSETQREGFSLVKRLWEVIGAGPLEIVGSYTAGHHSTKIFRELGIKALNSLCTWQNWLDGSDDNHWKIDHCGGPVPPYFIADDDFRKTAAGPSLLGFGMGTASSLRNYSIMCLEGCPTNASAAQRYSGKGAVSANVHRFYDAVEGWLHDVKNNPEPLFFTVGLENFAKSEDWAKANRLAVDYLVKRAKGEKLLFASAADIADYYQAHYTVQPEHVYYQPDVYCGYRVGMKPARVPDRIELNNVRFHSLHEEGQSLPVYFWDYTREWDQPEWAPQTDLRNKYGLITPNGKVNPAVVPEQVDTEGVHVNCQLTVTDDGVDLAVRITVCRAIAELPVGIWNVPLEQAQPADHGEAAACRWIGVCDGNTGNLHGIMVLKDVKVGDSEYRLTLRGVKRELRSADVDLGAIQGRCIFRDGVHHCYLWLTDLSKKADIEFKIPDGVGAKAIYNDGTIAEPDESGTLRVVLEGSWRGEAPMVVGLTPNIVQAGIVHDRQ